MLTNVYKDNATFNGKKVRFKRVNLQNYRAGKYVIRTYVNMFGDVDFSIFKILAKPRKAPFHCFPNKNRSEWSMKVFKEYVGGYKDNSYIEDVGILNNRLTCAMFEFNNKVLPLLEYLKKNNDNVNMLKILYGATDKEIENDLADFELEREMDRAYDMY